MEPLKQVGKKSRRRSLIAWIIEIFLLELEYMLEYRLEYRLECRLVGQYRIPLPLMEMQIPKLLSTESQLNARTATALYPATQRPS